MPDINAVIAKKVQERARAKSDRLFLACEVLGYDFAKETHEELFSQYPRFDENKTWVEQFTIRDVLVLWPRGHFKTTALVVIAVQAILNFPNIRILLMQGSVKVTKTLLKQIASHFEGTATHSRLQELFPEFCGDKRQLRLTGESFITPARTHKQLAQATCTVASPKSIKTSQHYDLGIFDDLVNDQNYDKPEKLLKIEENFNMCQPLIDPGCPRFVSGTRYAFGDLYENIIRRNAGKKDEWIISLKTCWLEGCDYVPRFPQYKTKDGRLVGFTKEMLLQIMRDSPGIYASQYLNQPVATSQQVLDEQTLCSAVIAESLTPALSSSVLFIDLASEGIHPDDSVIVAGKVDSLGRMYVTDMRGNTFTVAQLALNVIDMAIKHRPLKIMVERTPSAQYFVAYLQMVCKDKGIALPLDYIKVDNRENAKNIRVQAMAGHVKNKRLFFFPQIPCWDKFVEQTCQFPKGRYGHDDYPDTVALMCNFFAATYIGLAPMTPLSKHPVIARLMREPHMSGIDLLGKDLPSRCDDMGEGFCC